MERFQSYWDVSELLKTQKKDTPKEAKLVFCLNSK